MPSPRSGPGIKVFKAAPLRRLKNTQNGPSILHAAKPSHQRLDESSKAESNTTIGRVLSSTQKSMSFENRKPDSHKAPAVRLRASVLGREVKRKDRLQRREPSAQTPTPSNIEPLAADNLIRYGNGFERQGIREEIAPFKARPLQDSTSVSVEPREEKSERMRRKVLDPKNLGDYKTDKLEALLMVPRFHTQEEAPEASDPPALERRRFPRSIDVYTPRTAPANELEARTYLQIDLQFSHKKGPNPISDARMAWGYPLPETGFVPWESFRIFKGLPYSDHKLYERVLEWFVLTRRHFFVRLQPFVRRSNYKNWEIGFELRSKWLRQAADSIANALRGPSCAKPYMNEYGEEVKAFFVIAKNQIECQEEAEALLEQWMQQNMKFQRSVTDPRLKVWVQSLTLSFHKPWRPKEGDDVLWPEPKVYKLRAKKLRSESAGQENSILTIGPAKSRLKMP